MTRTLRLGTRGSPLARWQADWVRAQLEGRGCQVTLVPITTQGDQQQTGPIGAIGAQGVFTKEIQKALLEDQIDLAVHSLKDLPTDAVAGLTLAAVPPRELVYDALISKNGLSLDRLPHCASVATGSQRRRAQLLHERPDLQLIDLRGNVDTRLRKLDEGACDAIVLAEAGLRRLGLAARITQRLPFETMLPAVGQGALGIEARAADADTLAALAPLNDPAACAAVTAERALLAALSGGCLAPIAAHAHTLAVDPQTLKLEAAVLSVDGRVKAHARGIAPREEAVRLGRRVAEQLRDLGAAALVERSRHLVAGWSK